jgi:thiol:disulfide interchange protein DsbC
MKRRLFPLILFASLFTAHAGLADPAADTKAIEAALKKALPDLKPDSITPAPVKGLYEVLVGPKVFYMSADGRHVIQGSLIDIKTKSDLTEARMVEARVRSLEQVGVDKMVVFKPKIQRHVVHVFTDIDCAYCRKLHSEIDSYLSDGIEIRYLFFPRAGEGSESWNKAISVWCAQDRNDALTRAKKGESVESKACDNPVSQHMKLGMAMGATGTPMIVTPKGQTLPGYVNASQLSQMLAQEEKGAAQ